MNHNQNSKAVAVVVNYACHPTTLAWQNTLISPDYPGALRELVEFTLRTMLSFWVAPNDPARSREDLRRFIRRWLGGAILAQ